MMIESLAFVLFFAQIFPSHQTLKTYDEIRLENLIEIPEHISQIVDNIFNNLTKSNTDTATNLRMTKIEAKDGVSDETEKQIQLSFDAYGELLQYDGQEDMLYYIESLRIPSSYCKNIEFKCDKKYPYRTIDGSCNNLEHSWWGSSRTIYSRFLKSDYEDKIGMPRMTGKNGYLLPNERDVSMRLVNSFETEAKTTIFSLSHGQLLTHDCTRVMQIRKYDGSQKSCPCDTKDKDCFNIPTPPGDILNYDQKCMSKVRNRGVSRDLDCNLRSREQMNANSAFIDLTVVYGNDEKTAAELRKFKGGLLKSSFTPYSNLEQLARRNETRCPYSSDRTEKCFIAGDPRAEDNLMLLSVHALWLREHNRIARKLAYLNPDWNDETLYQEARRLTIAEFQHITSNEYFPIVVGEKLAADYGLLPLKRGYFLEYEKNLFPAIINEFAGNAFRIYHTIVVDEIRRGNSYFKLYEKQNVSTYQFNTIKFAINSRLEDVLYGNMAQPTYYKECQMNTDMKNYLFEGIYQNKYSKRFDLMAINTHLGRDHGFQRYFKYRVACGLSRPDTFEDLRDNIPDHIIKRLKKIYRHVEDIDLYAGLVSEEPLKGLSVGYTSACIIAKQFSILKRGDRFWYENGHDKNTRFTLDQLDQIREVTMARIICDNTNAKFVQKYPFLMPDPEYNPYIECKYLPIVDLKPWEDYANQINKYEADESEDKK